MRTCSLWSFRLAAVAMTASLGAQVPEGHLVVATAATPAHAGQAGVWFVDPAHGVATMVQGLPCELQGACAGAAGSNCVVRDPRSERLLAGSLVPNGGPVSAWLLTLQANSVVAAVACPIGVAAAGGGVNAAVFLADGDVLLGVGGITSGPFAGAPILRWTPPSASQPSGQLMPLALPASYGTVGNECTALVGSGDGRTAFAACRNSAAVGAFATQDVLQIEVADDTSGGPVSVLPSSLAAGDVVTHLWWSCDGNLMASVAQVPSGAGGRMLRWSLAWGVAWTPWPDTSWPGLVDLRGGVAMNGACAQYFAGTIAGQSTVQCASSAMVAATVSAGPATLWGEVRGLDGNHNPEIVATPSGSGIAVRWSRGGWTGGQPVVGNHRFALPLAVANLGTLRLVLVDVAQQAAVPFLGALVHVTPQAVVLLQPPVPGGTIGSGGGYPGMPTMALTQWPLPLPPIAGLRGLELFAQGFTLGSSGVGGSDLLHFTIR